MKDMRRRIGGRRRLLACALLVALATATAGCSEQWQRKFIRKRKSQARLTPVVSFEDYTSTTTPLDRYRKHYILFQYWNAELIELLGSTSINAKRAKNASAEGLEEFRQVVALAPAGSAPSAAAMIEERERINRDIQRESYSGADRDRIRQALEKQTRQIHREMAWQKLIDQLSDEPAPATRAAAPDAAASPPPAQ